MAHHQVDAAAVMDHLDFGQATTELTQAAKYLREQGATKVEPARLPASSLADLLPCMLIRLLSL